jgi:hypothetical protein
VNRLVIAIVNGVLTLLIFTAAKFVNYRMQHWFDGKVKRVKPKKLPKQADGRSPSSTTASGSKATGTTTTTTRHAKDNADVVDPDADGEMFLADDDELSALTFKDDNEKKIDNNNDDDDGEAIMLKEIIPSGATTTTAAVAVDVSVAIPQQTPTTIDATPKV